MIQENVLEQFEEEEVQSRVQEVLFELDSYYHAHQEHLVHRFVEAIRGVCLKALALQKEEKKGEIAYITCSMLRTEILDERDVYLLEASDPHWFLDQITCEAEYDASWAFRYLHRLKQVWLEVAPQYGGAVKAPEIERIMLREAENFHQYIVSLVRYAMPQVLDLPEYQQLNHAEQLEFRVGEYLDQSEVVYKEDSRELDAETIREDLAEQDTGSYAYEVLNGVDLSGMELEQIDLRYARFQQCNVSRSKLSGAIFIGTRWEKCELEQADLSFALLWGADFTGCRMKQAKLPGVLAGQGLLNPSKWTMPGFPEVSFRAADLEGADFSGADLKGAIFIDANLHQANFQGARLEGTVFSISAQEQIQFSAEQRQSVIWFDSRMEEAGI